MEQCLEIIPHASYNDVGYMRHYKRLIIKTSTLGDKLIIKEKNITVSLLLQLYVL